MSPRMCVFVAFALGACGGRLVDSMDRTETSTGDGTSSVESASSTAGGAEPATDSGPGTEPELESGTDSDAGSELDDDTGPVVGDCHPIEAVAVEHDAFSGTWCPGAPNESAVLTTQAEVDAHVATYCESCWWEQQPCPQRPKLKKDTAIVYAYTGTPMGALHLEILSVEDCGGAVVVEAEAKMDCTLALSRAWSSVVVPAFDKPVVFEIALPFPEECKRATCPEGSRECLRHSDCSDGMTCITGCCALPP
jgi:hypothetical protein